MVDVNWNHYNRVRSMNNFDWSLMYLLLFPFAITIVCWYRKFRHFDCLRNHHWIMMMAVLVVNQSLSIIHFRKTTKIRKDFPNCSTTTTTTTEKREQRLITLRLLLMRIHSNIKFWNDNSLMGAIQNDLLIFKQTLGGWR